MTDYKSQLNLYYQNNNNIGPAPLYSSRRDKKTGKFKTILLYNKRSVESKGMSTKKLAEQDAAHKMLDIIHEKEQITIKFTASTNKYSSEQILS